MSTAFRIQMDNVQENPDTTSPGSGLGTVVFDSVAVTAAYNITVTGLDFGPLLGLPSQTVTMDDDVAGIHVHNAARNVNGPIVFGQRGPAQDNDDFAIGINANGSTTFSGIWETTDPPNGANPGLSTFAATLAAATLGADVSLYWNIHTHAFPGGAIRGQWVCIATDNSETVTGTDGNDILPGLGGDDTVNGGIGDDDINGGDGNDTLNGGVGKDTLDGGANVDTADFSDKTLAVVLTLNGATNATATVGGVVEDTVRNVENVTGGSAADTLSGDSLANTLIGGGHNDILKGGGGNDIIDGGINSDFVDYRDKTLAVVLTLNGATDATATVGGVAEDTVRNVENIFGGTANDVLTGDGAANFLNGFNGGDTLKGGLGADTLEGGAGLDTADYRDKTAAVIVTLDTVNNVFVSVGGVNEDTIRNVENVYGGSGVDRLTGDNLANFLFGFTGNDQLRGGLGNDTLDGGAGVDIADYLDRSLSIVVTLTGSVNATVRVNGFVEDTVRNIENVYGGTADDVLTGDSLANYLYGYAGNDLLTGSGGNDRLAGATGGDIFLFETTLNAVTNVDHIVDFATEDTIELFSDVFTGMTDGTLAPEAFLAAAGATAAADADDRIVYNTTTGALFFDFDGVGGAASIQFAVLDNKATLTNADIIVV